MNKLKTLVLGAAIAFSTVLFASTNPEKNDEPTTTINQTVGDLLKNPNFELEKDQKATVTLLVNSENEIVVLSVDTKNEYIENYIKSRLNYETIAESLSTKQRYFKVPVRIVKSI